MRVAINGFGRIGRNVLRALLDAKYSKIDCAVINCGPVSGMENNLHLLRYDSTHGVLEGIERVSDRKFRIKNREIELIFETEISKINWGEYDVDIVLECTGKFTEALLALEHIKSGAGAVIVSAPCKGADATIVYGVNHSILSHKAKIISAGSCTTNCLAPMAKLMQENFGIVNGFMTTVHAYTNDQSLLDGDHKDLRRARAAAVSIIPAATGAASTIGAVIPELDGKLDGAALRVPVSNVSMLELTLNLEKETSVAEINSIFRDASLKHMEGIIRYEDVCLVSVDFNGSTSSCIFDATLTKVSKSGRYARICGWYDNETGFSHRMLDISLLFSFK